MAGGAYQQNNNPNGLVRAGQQGAPNPFAMTPGYTPPQQGGPGAYTDPVTGGPGNTPLPAVPATTQYQAAAGLKSQGESEEAASKLSAQQSQEMMSRSAQQAQLNAENQMRMGSQIPEIMKGFTGGSPTLQYGGTGGSDFEAAKNSAFARGKDAAGTTARSALDALRNVMAGNNMSGSGNYLARAGGIVSGAAGQMGDMNREQMIQDLGAETHVADQNLQAGVTQRGQNLNMGQALLQLMQGRAY